MKKTVRLLAALWYLAGKLTGQQRTQAENAAAALEKAYAAAVKAERKSAENEGAGARYSLKARGVYDYSKSFAEQIADYEAGKIPERDSLLVGRTPEVFRKIGMTDLPVTINQQHIEYALHGTKDFDHALGAEGLRQLPKALESPVAILSSKTKNGSSLVAMLEIRQNGKQVVVPVAIDGYGTLNWVQIDSNAVTSVYGKNFSISKVLKNALEDEANGKPFSVYYVNKEKAARLFEVARVPMPKVPQSSPDGFIHSIREAGSPVNPKLENVTQTQQFKRWFGDWQNHPENASKVVNEDGTPKVVYHGTGSDFNAFDPLRQGENYPQGEGGFFFTTSRKSAENYAALHDKDGKGRVVEAYLSIRNPYEVTAYGDYVQAPAEKYDDHRSEYLNEAERQGCDGIIVKGERSTLYVVFDPTQIKSATDNIGTFDRENPDIRYSLKRDAALEKDFASIREQLEAGKFTEEQADRLREEAVDRLLTQADKLARIDRAGWKRPEGLAFVPVDFTRDSLAERLCSAGFDPATRAFFSWLGVTYYLPAEAVEETLAALSGLCAAGSALVFDYPDEGFFSAGERRVQNTILMARAGGEPMRSAFSRPALEALLQKHGFRIGALLTPEDIQRDVIDRAGGALKAFEHVNYCLAIREE